MAYLLRSEWRQPSTVGLLIEETVNQAQSQRILVSDERIKPESPEEEKKTNLSEQRKEPTNSTHEKRHVRNRTQATLVECEGSQHFISPARRQQNYYYNDAKNLHISGRGQAQVKCELAIRGTCWFRGDATECPTGFKRCPSFDGGCASPENWCCCL